MRSNRADRHAKRAFQGHLQAVSIAAGAVCLAFASIACAPAQAQTNPVPHAAPAATESSPRAAAEALERVRALLAQNRRDEALAALDRALASAPSDAQLRFQRGVLLSRMGRTDEAIAAFTALTHEFPELPEPFNNLAVLRAQRGELDLARAALEEALRALPSYSLARENLGDVQLRLAERSYQRALDADAGNRAAREKLERTRELITRLTPPAASAATTVDGADPSAVPAPPPQPMQSH
ncbi:MAG: tetratricopeptide repeat protein [Burkholderiaceae bacterium]|nr:tetratricopeptide repeat protein [Burkholderiaceae bacterium]